MKVYFVCLLLSVVTYEVQILESDVNKKILLEAYEGDGNCIDRRHKREAEVTTIQKCSLDSECDGTDTVCKLDGKCGFKGKGKGLKNEECEHVTDCVQGLFCVKSKCASSQTEDDSCESHADCKSEFYCSGLENSKKGLCHARRSVGFPCKENYHCINSLCLEERYVISGHDKIIKTESKFCVTIEVAACQTCNPTQKICLPGFICTNISKQLPKLAFKGKPKKGLPVAQPQYQEQYNPDGNNEKRRRKRSVDSSAYETLSDLDVSDEDDSREESIEENHARKGRKGNEDHSSEKHDYQYEEHSGFVPQPISIIEEQKGTPFKADGQFICKIAPKPGSQEPCQNSQACSCGEYCDFPTQTCKTAFCILATDCLSYSGFSQRFQCKNNICVPSQEIYLEAFVLKFDGENIPNAPNGGKAPPKDTNAVISTPGPQVPKAPIAPKFIPKRPPKTFLINPRALKLQKG